MFCLFVCLSVCVCVCVFVCVCVCRYETNCETEIKNSLTNFSSDWCNEKGVPVKCFTSIGMEKFIKKIKKLKSKFRFSKVKQVVMGPQMISYLKVLQEEYVMCPMDEAANNIAFICKKYHVQIFLKEIGLLNSTSTLLNK